MNVDPCPQNNTVPAPNEEAFAQAKIKILALHIVDNYHLKRILFDAKPELRKQVYEMIKPHLRFKAKSFNSFNFRKYA